MNRGSIAHVSRFGLTAALILGSGAPAHAQNYSLGVRDTYRMSLNVTSMKSGNWDGKLDVYSRRDVSSPMPTIVWIHGGGPTGGAKEYALFYLLPYLERGWNVVNVEHRLAGVTLAPAAVQNTVCALRWTIQNAKEYGFDTSKLMVRLHDALNRAGVRQELVTILGGRHGGFSREEHQRAFAAIDAFLAQLGIRSQ